MYGCVPTCTLHHVYIWTWQEHDMNMTFSCLHLSSSSVCEYTCTCTWVPCKRVPCKQHWLSERLLVRIVLRTVQLFSLFVYNWFALLWFAYVAGHTYVHVQYAPQNSLVMTCLAQHKICPDSLIGCDMCAEWALWASWLVLCGYSYTGTLWAVRAGLVHVHYCIVNWTIATVGIGLSGLSDLSVLFTVYCSPQCTLQAPWTCNDGIITHILTSHCQDGRVMWRILYIHTTNSSIHTCM